MTWPGMRLRKVRRVCTIVVVALFALMVLTGVSGWLVFSNASTDLLQRADAVVVLGGEHDGRENYGISLARAGWAPVVVLSNPYDDGDRVMRSACRAAVPSVEILCPRPAQQTTRGEAQMVRSLAAQRGWSKVIVVTWRYHLPRARLVFRQCFSDRRAALVMLPVPQHYAYSWARWEMIYTYQYAAWIKAMALGDCR